MLILLGYTIVGLCVFGAYLMMGGTIGALYQPLELILIGGAAIGSYIAANSGNSMKAMGKAIPKALKRSPYDQAYYMELMGLLYALLAKARKDGLMSIESDIEAPWESALFERHPLIMSDSTSVTFICDYARLMVSGNMSAYEVETLMDQELDTYRHEAHVPVRAMQVVADGLPAFGIVAAVLGVIKALAAVDQPPAVLADLISKAMVGTFLGIFMAYGYAAPIASAMERRNDATFKSLECIKVTLLAYMNGYPPQLAVEFGRKVLFSSERPTFLELEEHVRNTKTGRSADRSARK